MPSLALCCLKKSIIAINVLLNAILMGAKRCYTKDKVGEKIRFLQKL